MKVVERVVPKAFPWIVNVNVAPYVDTAKRRWRWKTLSAHARVYLTAEKNATA